MSSSGSFDGVPFVAFSNAELAECPSVEAGERIVCERCHGEHELTDSDPAGLLLFIDCGGQPCLAAIDGALVFGHTPAVPSP